ncbi:MAG: nucleotidyltransferase family protein [Dehalococcoidia bacterium]|nr:nucleotidyltransferase family protein [Dehalococcoidia bacterium]
MFALVLAGGKGERLRPLTSDRPKPMVPVAGRPILEHHLAWLRENGVTDVVLLCGYRHEAIESHFGDGARFGLRVRYSVEDEPLGRGGAFKLGWRQVPESERVVIGTNGDNMVEQPLAPLLRQHERTGATATVMLAPLRSPFGVVRLRGSRILGFDEKPLLPYWVNAGVYALGREFFSMLPDVGDHETTVFPALASERRLYGFKSRAYWKPIDTLKDVREAEEHLHGMAGKMPAL